MPVFRMRITPPFLRGGGGGSLDKKFYLDRFGDYDES